MDFVRNASFRVLAQDEDERSLLDVLKNVSVRVLPKDEGERIFLEAQERSILDSLGDTLPFDLLELGLRLFGSGANLKRVVSSTHAVQATVFGIGVTLRMLEGDNALERLPHEASGDEYGLDDILKKGPPNHGMVNVIDMGSNLGVVPIALYHKYPTLARVVAIEPIPLTYFLLRWNLYLNKVPVMNETEMAKTGSDRTPGVLALNRAVIEDDKSAINACWSPENSMNAAICDCDHPPFPKDQFQCLTVNTIAVPTILKFFGDDGIDLFKMDCEGCEMHTLQVLDLLDDSWTRIRRLAGELHEVPPNIEDIACKFNYGTWVTKVCTFPIGSKPIECDPQTRSPECYKPVPWPRP